MKQQYRACLVEYKELQITTCVIILTFICLLVFEISTCIIILTFISLLLFNNTAKDLLRPWIKMQSCLMESDLKIVNICLQGYWMGRTIQALLCSPILTEI